VRNISKPSFWEVWKRIVANEGKEFKTITNLPFTYEIRKDTLCPSRTKYNISKSDFAKVFESVPIAGPVVISKYVRGPSYIWSVLHDQRISQGKW
jgi:hypothetical protein